jgi:hypothetical protein
VAASLTNPAIRERFSKKSRGSWAFGASFVSVTCPPTVDRATPEIRPSAATR